MSDKNRMQVTPGTLPKNAGESTLANTDLLSMAPLAGKQSRPWNPLWYIYQLLSQRYVSDMHQQLLVINCGQGDAAIRLAMLGYDVYGIDSDPTHIDWARESALRHGVTDHCHFTVMTPDKLQHEDERFDVIVGMDALKQSDYACSITQMYRTLKPGGTALFKEQAQTRFDQSNAQSTALTVADIDLLSQAFDTIQTRRFTILSRLDHLIPHSSESTRTALEKLDSKLLNLCPPMASLGATVVITCTKMPQSLTDGMQFAA